MTTFSCVRAHHSVSPCATAPHTELCTKRSTACFPKRRKSRNFDLHIIVYIIYICLRGGERRVRYNNDINTNCEGRKGKKILPTYLDTLRSRRRKAPIRNQTEAVRII